jgi:hypothetical protein
MMLILVGSNETIAQQQQYQRPSDERMNLLSRGLEEASRRLEERGKSLFASERPQFKNPFAKLMDRLKPPTDSMSEPRLGLMDKLKDLNPFAGREFSLKPNSPMFSGMSNLFKPRERTGPTLLERLTGNSFGSTIGEDELARLNNMAREGFDGGAQYGRETQSGMKDLFSRNRIADEFPRPSLRSARQNSAQAPNF